MFHLVYKGQELIDVGTADAIGRSLEREPQRWRNEFIWLTRDDGLKITIFRPYENKLADPRWIERDVFGEERLVTLPTFAAYLLKIKVQTWFKKYGNDVNINKYTQAQINSGSYNRIGVRFNKAA